MTNHSLKIGWLYPDLMSTYGDRGNIIVLQKRCEWRGIKTEIINIDQETSDSDLKSVDILFGGGAQDREQHIVIEDLQKKKKQIKDLIENNIPSLFVCGSPQLLGKYYEPEKGKKIEGLGIFDITSTHPGENTKRLVGDVIARICWENFKTEVIASKAKQSFKTEIATSPTTPRNDTIIVGFENHGGRTVLGTSAKPFAKILKGNGNNGSDGTEGVVYKNAIGSYFHGPLLTKNPEISDWLIKKALELKYNRTVELSPLDDNLSQKAKSVIAKRLGIKL